MTLKIEIGCLAAVCFGAGLYASTIDADAAIAAQPELAVEAFTLDDFAAFDRDFETREGPCEVGLKMGGLCFEPSPLEAELQRGEVLGAHVPAISAEMRVILVTDLKAERLRTARYGQTLALIDVETREVVDLLDLTPGGRPQVSAQPAS